MEPHQIAESIVALAGVQGVALTDHVGVPLASFGVDSAVAEQLGATAFLLYRLAERCSGIVNAGRVEWAVLQSQQDSLAIVASDETHLVVLADDSVPSEDLVERIARLTEPPHTNEIIPRQHSSHEH